MCHIHGCNNNLAMRNAKTWYDVDDAVRVNVHRTVSVNEHHRTYHLGRHGDAQVPDTAG